MKLLTSEQQQDLQALMESLKDVDGVETKAAINYWAIELKPKRVRKKNEVVVDNIT